MAWLHSQLSDQRQKEYRLFGSTDPDPRGGAAGGPPSSATSSVGSKGNKTKPSEFFDLHLQNYTKEDLILELRHLRLDLDFYKGRAGAAERKVCVLIVLRSRTSENSKNSYVRHERRVVEATFL